MVGGNAPYGAMNIVHVYDGHEQIYNGQGSLPRIVWNVAQRTAARGHDVTIIERQWDGLPAVSRHEGVNFRRVRLSTGSDEPWNDVPYEMVQSLSGLGKLVVDRTNFGIKSLAILRKLDFDAVHVHLPFAANVLVTIAPWLRSQTVFTAQLGELRLDALSGGVSSSPGVPSAVQRFSPDVYLAKRTAYTTVLNQNVKRIFRQNGVAPESLVHIPNGVDVEKFGQIDQTDRDRLREKFELEDRPVVFFAGTIMPRKGVAELIQAAGTVVDAGYDDVRFLLAGETDLDEEYARRVRALVAEHDIKENVQFTGYLTDEDLLPAYEAADIFVLPSFEEGFGMVVAEAMAANTPVVASRINGVKQQVDDQTTGMLVDAGIPDQIASAVIDLLNDREKRERMGERSRRRAQRFGWERITDRYVSLYRNVAR